MSKSGIYLRSKSNKNSSNWHEGYVGKRRASRGPSTISVIFCFFKNIYPKRIRGNVHIFHKSALDGFIVFFAVLSHISLFFFLITVLKSSVELHICG